MKKALCGLVIVLAGLGAYAANVLATPAGGQTTTTLAKSLAAEPVNISGHSTHPAGAWRARLRVARSASVCPATRMGQPGSGT